jgi:hypothetical protein
MTPDFVTTRLLKDLRGDSLVEIIGVTIPQALLRADHVTE